MKLLQSQKDLIFEMIQSHDLTPFQFKFEEARYQSENVDILLFRDSDYYFKFQITKQYHVIFECLYSPGVNSLTFENSFRSFDDMIYEINLWLSSLKREITTPNHWDQIASDFQQLNFPSITNNHNKFSASEYLILNDKMNLLINQIHQLELLPNQIEAFENNLKYLIEIAVDMKKIDWKNQFVGVIFSLILQLSITPEISKEILTYIQSIFNSFFLN